MDSFLNFFGTFFAKKHNKPESHNNSDLLQLIQKNERSRCVSSLSLNRETRRWTEKGFKLKKEERSYLSNWAKLEGE